MPSMADFWFDVVTVMLGMYAVTDGFDLGAGALHLFLARDDRERRQILAAIGPWWDGNEVWLLAAGGALFVAFPRVLASGLSGFYFAIFLVLWCLLGRGVAIEFRHAVAHPMWKAFWDAVFFACSLLLAVFFGAALGNLIRGLPLDAGGWFSLTLFTNFTARPPVGILDVYTIAAGAFTALVLCTHGAAFLAMRCEGGVESRALALYSRLLIARTIAWPVMTLATWAVFPGLWHALTKPGVWAGVLFALQATFFAFLLPARTGRTGRMAFGQSVMFITGLLVATASALRPALLRSIGDPALSLTFHNSAAAEHGLRIAANWLALGLPLAVLYLLVLMRLHRARVTLPAEGGAH
jgi:cytochrome d ubiquinol oxidase subunit II